MTARTFSSDAPSLIYINLDGKPFFRIKLVHSSSAAELRAKLSEKHRLPLNTYFVDIKGYRISEADENRETIEQLLHTNDTIILKRDDIISEQDTSMYNSNLKEERTKIGNKYRNYIMTELFSILEWLWCLCLKPSIIIILTCLFMYYTYTKIICHHGRFLPFVTMYCAAEQMESIPIPPVSKLAESSVSLADTLINADASAPMRFVQVKTSLIQLRAQVIYSDIEVNVRNELSEQMLELQRLVQTGSDQLTTMLASFGGAIDKLRIYTQFALEDLSEVINPGMRRSKDPLKIGYSEMEVRDKLTKSFGVYMTSVSEQIDKILFKAQDAYMSLETIKNKLETIQELTFKGRHISQARIDELKHGSYWSWLFDKGKLGIVKHERNLKLLDGFINFVNAASNNVNDVIIQLKIFRHNAEDLKQTGTLLEESPHMSISKHKQLLEASLKRLIESKEKFEEKKQLANRQTETN